MIDQKKILVIDDEPNTQGALKDLFGGAGYVVYSALDAKEGLRKARELHPDLALLDIMMPTGGGHDIYVPLKRACGSVLIYSSAPSFLIEGKVPGLTKADVVSKGTAVPELLSIVQQRLTQPPASAS